MASRKEKERPDGEPKRSLCHVVAGTNGQSKVCSLHAVTCCSEAPRWARGPASSFLVCSRGCLLPSSPWLSMHLCKLLQGVKVVRERGEDGEQQQKPSW